MVFSNTSRGSLHIFSEVSARENSLDEASPVTWSLVRRDSMHETRTLNGSPSRCETMVTAGVFHCLTASLRTAMAAWMSVAFISILQSHLYFPYFHPE